MRQIGSYELITPAASEPLSQAVAKAFTRAEHSSENALFDSLVVAARLHVEKDCGLALINQTWRATFDTWDERGLRLRPHKVSAVTAVEVWDGTQWAEQDAAGFQLIEKRPALLLPVDNVTPATPQRSRNGVRVTFTAGFGAAATDVPDDLLLAMKQLVKHWYENREPTGASDNLANVGTVPFTVTALLSPYRVLRLS